MADKQHEVSVNEYDIFPHCTNGTLSTLGKLTRRDEKTAVNASVHISHNRKI